MWAHIVSPTVISSKAMKIQRKLERDECKRQSLEVQHSLNEIPVIVVLGQPWSWTYTQWLSDNNTAHPMEYEKYHTR